MVSDLEFVQCLAAKICHDLAGTLGAVSNALEFLESNDPSVKKKAMELIELSSTQANIKLKTFRHAYGLAKYSGDADISVIRDLCQSLVTEDKITVEFSSPASVSGENALDVGAGKLLLCIVALAKSALIYGGTIKVTLRDNEGKNTVAVTASGKNLKLQSEMHDIINGDIGEITPNNVQAYYIKRLAESLKLKVSIGSGIETVSYIID